jgi:hypothetical protein
MRASIVLNQSFPVSWVCILYRAYVTTALGLSNGREDLGLMGWSDPTVGETQGSALRKLLIIYDRGILGI